MASKTKVPKAGTTTWPEGHNPISTGRSIHCSAGDWESHPMIKTDAVRWDAFEAHCRKVKNRRNVQI